MSFIGVVRWSSLDRWSVVADHVDRASLHPKVALHDVLKQRREKITLDGDFGEWRPVTVHLDGQISARKGAKPYKGTTFVAYAGDLVFSKIDARHGAIGIIPAAMPQAVVTAEFPVFSVDETLIDPTYLRLVLRTGGFHHRVKALATGTSGRKRTTPEAFLRMEIPLPPLDQQRAIVEAHKTGLTEADALDASAAAAEAAMEAEFEAALGLAAPPPAPSRPVFVARFSELDRWSHDGVSRRAPAPEHAAGGGPAMVPLAAVAVATTLPN